MKEVVLKVTKEMAEAEVIGEVYFTALQGIQGAVSDSVKGEASLRTALNALDPSLGNVTLCVLTLRNDAKVIGFNYGAINVVDNDPELARAMARKMAMDKVFELLGFRLRDQRLPRQA